MFNSLHGLQQRLDDFSLDDLSKAIDKTKTLSLRLAELQRRLGALIAIRQFATATSSAIEKATVEFRDLYKSETVNHASRFPETAQAGRLVKFPRPARSVSDAIQGVGKSPTETGTEKSNGSAHAATEHPELIQPTDNPTIDREWSLAPDPSFDPGEDWTLESTEATMPAEQTFVECAASEPEQIETGNTHHTDGETTLGATPEPTASSEEGSTEPFVSPLADAQQEPAFLAEEPSTSGATTPSDKIDAKALVPAGTAFDQRLLDDLIKDYGEFASSPYVPAPITPKKETQPSIKIEDSKTSPLSADEDHSASRHLPSIQKEGEIDRKLKKLIKDYGEYDLYSRQSPVNLKTGVIGAFVLLGVIFLGFYFFSAPKPVDSSQPSSITEPAETPLSNRGSLQNAKSRNAIKTPKGAAGEAVELPRTAEPSERNTANPIPLKKKN